MPGNATTALAPGSCETYDPPKPDILLEHVLRIQGYRDLTRVRDDVRAIATKMAARAGDLLAPTVVYRPVPVRACDGETLTLITGTRFSSAEFAGILGHCDRVIPFVLTLGNGLDQEVIGLLDSGDIVEALFLETAGWLAIEQASRSFARHLQQWALADGFRLTRRLGPGYKDWDLREQRSFFELFSDTELPVHLMESCAMIPKKSRSGLYGLAPLSKPRHNSQLN